jgi:hypothetical protein
MNSLLQSISQDKSPRPKEDGNCEYGDHPENACVALVRSKVALSSRFHGGVSIINLSTGAYFRLDAIGSRIWQALARPITTDEIRAELVDDFAPETDVGHTTIIAFVDSLKRAGLVVVA